MDKSDKILKRINEVYALLVTQINSSNETSMLLSEAVQRNTEALCKLTEALNGRID